MLGHERLQGVEFSPLLVGRYDKMPFIKVQQDFVNDKKQVFDSNSVGDRLLCATLYATGNSERPGLLSFVRRSLVLQLDKEDNTSVFN